MRRLYFDHAASTPADPRAVRAMRPFFSREFGNPGSLHYYGQQAIAAVDGARERIGKLIGAKHFREVIFTGGATEANNLALRGAVAFFRRAHPDVARPRIVISSIEHESVAEPARALAGEWGVDVVELPVNREGVIDIMALKDALSPETALVSVMHVNNEIGTIEPLREIRFMIDAFRKDRAAAGRPGPYPLFHTDAAQSFPYYYLDTGLLGVDMMTLSSQKTYGPKGAGALFVRRDDDAFGAPGGEGTAAGFPLVAQNLGGGQEFGLRSGTENVPAIVGFAKAAEIAAAARGKTSLRVAALRDDLWRRIKTAVPAAEINGTAGDAKAPHILNIHFPGHPAQDLLTRFDRMGLAASSGSACAARAAVPSRVIEALGHGKARAAESVRFSVGKGTTRGAVAAAARIIERAVNAVAR